MTSPGRGVRLGVDVGSVRVGVARSDPDGLLAMPEATLRRDPGGAADLAHLAALSDELAVTMVYVGLPKLLSGAEGQAAQTARDYAKALASRIGELRVRMIDERLTTVEAHRKLRESGVPGRGQRAVVDQAAAVAILQHALDLEKSTGAPAGEPLTPARKPRTKERRR